MQSVQRRFGKARTADESQVAVLLKDFDDADKMLTRIIDASKAWRDSWRDILVTQQRLVYDFQDIYSPIIESNEHYEGHEVKETPRSTMMRTVKLQQAYDELKTDLLEEVDVVDARIIKPAMEAKDHIQPLKKVIKKRGDRKLEFEKYQSRVDSGRKKTKRSDKDNAALAKAETELYHATEEYTIADDNLKRCLPPVITAAFSLLPNLLAAQIMTQNSLLAQSYTVLHEYCGEARFPSPPPPMNEIVSSWDRSFRLVQREAETGFACISNGKAVRQPMKLADQSQSHSISGLNIRNGYAQRRTSSQSTNQTQPVKALASPALAATSEPPSPEPNTRPKISSVPSQSSLALAVPSYGSSTLSSPSPGDTQGAHAPAAPRADYFSRDRQPSSSSMASIAAGKKKPPPPPPKRTPSTQDLFVRALYEFAGQSQGDLVFREGDCIRVVKKTDSTDDWWEGELKGVKGSFPANYCQVI